VELLDELATIAEQVRAELGVRPTAADWADAREELMHVFLHEACHAALSNAAPWIHDLPDEQHTAVDEVVARLLEDHMARRLGLYAHTPQQHVHELEMYPVRISVEQYAHLTATWRASYGPSKDLDGMARYTQRHLFSQAKGCGREEDR
jgi:hypothetical protein